MNASLLKRVLRKSWRITKRLIEWPASFVLRLSLRALCIVNECDKWGVHFYAKHYQRFFAKYRFSKIKILEIGIGGEQDPNSGGRSLKVWSWFFWRAKIVAFDLYPKNIRLRRVKVLQGDQSNESYLENLGKTEGPFDIIIDDGSHIPEHVRLSLQVLWKYLKNGGLYCIEDLQTAYWKSFGGDNNPESRESSYWPLKQIVDEINYKEIPSYSKGQFAENCVGIHFWHNLCIIEKDLNLEETNRGGRQ